MSVIVITGSSRGIGLGLARELAARSARVVVCGRHQDTVDAAVANVTERTGGSNVVGAVCDVTEASSVAGLWDTAVAAFGRVDHWINNAGSTTTPIDFWTVPSQQVEQVIRTNVTGVLHGSALAAGRMRQQDGGGWIWNVEGMGSKGEVQKGMTTYATSKASVGQLMKALRKDIAANAVEGSPVRVGAIRPGINITEHLLTDVEVLDPARWAKQKKVLNILGDLPETTTPWLAEQLLAATKDGTRIQWLPPTKIAKRFATSWRNDRDLFAEVAARRDGA